MESSDCSKESIDKRRRDSQTNHASLSYLSLSLFISNLACVTETRFYILCGENYDWAVTSVIYCPFISNKYIFKILINYETLINVTMSSWFKCKVTNVFLPTAYLNFSDFLWFTRWPPQTPLSLSFLPFCFKYFDLNWKTRQRTKSGY